MLEAFDPKKIIGTNANDPVWQPTVNHLEQGELAIPPIHVLEVGDELWVIDGNHRRDYCDRQNLPIGVLVIQTDNDWLQVRETTQIGYSKVRTICQLQQLLGSHLNRVKIG